MPAPFSAYVGLGKGGLVRGKKRALGKWKTAGELDFLCSAMQIKQVSMTLKLSWQIWFSFLEKVRFYKPDNIYMMMGETSYSLQMRILPIRSCDLPASSPPTRLFGNWIMLRDVQINANKKHQNSQNWGICIIFFLAWSSQAGATRSILHMTFQREGITWALDELYHAHLLCEQIVCLWKEQHMDSATLEACHSFGEMCVKWLEKKKKSL